MKILVQRLAVMAITASLFFALSACGQDTSDRSVVNMEYEALVAVTEETARPEQPLKSVSEEDDTGNESVSVEPEDSLESPESAEEAEPVPEAEKHPSVDPAPESEPAESATTESVQYTVYDISKTVYTITNLNVRSGPSVKFNVVGSFTTGTAVAVTGVCNETGWYRCSYSGSDAYFDSDYVADTVTSAQPKNEAQTAESSAAATVSPSPAPSPSKSVAAETYVSGGFPFWNYSWHSGAYIGRMHIPSVGVNVGLYNTNVQSVIDAWDSAAIDYYWELSHDVYEYSTIYCADHNYQGLRAIMNCSIGDAMYIDGVDGNTYKYICDRIDYNGYNTGWGLNDSDGNSVNCTGGLWCYTCHDDSDKYIYMVHFYAA